ncbi:type IV secretion system DNA-binding domain-containing protein [Burkholderia cepacia]|uniref:type IV secretion system DNA-binding domain-containing protein n=1 Tax=Burkholderia cepacia TaxID=292 RepID=UPI001589B61D|nr:type IV secretion system DNA-binding domain-containing protein [Burkholderia cepacia]
MKKKLFPKNSQVRFFSKSIIDPAKPVVYLDKALGLGITTGLLATTVAVGAAFSIPIALPPSPFTEPHLIRDALYHTKMFWEMWIGHSIGQLIPLFKPSAYDSYLNYMNWLGQNGDGSKLSERWLISELVGLYAGIKTTLGLLKPVYLEEQTGGRVLYKGEEAYFEMKKLFDRQIKNSGGIESFVLESNIGFIPNKPETYHTLKKHELITMPDSQRRQHFFALGSSRRGKTQWLLKRLMWLYFQIRRGRPYKILLIETPKNDYSQYINEKDQIVLAIDEKAGQALAWGHDFILKQDAEQYMLGKIPDPEGGDPIWTTAARAFATACFVCLQETSGEDWDEGALSYLMQQSVPELKEMVIKYYPEATLTVNLDEKPLSSMLATMENYVRDFFQSAEIYCGAKYKKDIEQLNARMLKHKFNQERLANRFFPPVDKTRILPDGTPLNITENILINKLFKGILKEFVDTYIETHKKQFKWEELSYYLKQDYKTLFMIGYKYLSKSDKGMWILMKTTKTFLIENLKEKGGETWIFENEKTMMEFLDSEYKTDMNAHHILKSLIRKKNYAIKVSEINEYLKKWEDGDYLELADIVVNNLTADELSKIINKNDYKKFVEGCKPIFEWCKTWDKYEETPRFSFKDWVLDENPKSKILSLKVSERFESLTRPLVNGLLFYMKGLVLDKFYPDDKTQQVPLRNFWVFADEFQQLGNIKNFIAPMLALAAGRGITLCIACQDISQLEEIYSAEFVRFLMSNVGNLVILGTNQGETAQKLSDHLGKKYISKTHQSISYNDGKASHTINIQEHEGIVIKPDEINSLLGLDLNGDFDQSIWEEFMDLPKQPMNIRYLYVPSNAKPAFILETPVCGYFKKSTPQKPDWQDNKRYYPEEIDIEDMILSGLLLKPIEEVEVVENDISEPQFSKEEELAIAESLESETVTKTDTKSLEDSVKKQFED